MRAVQNYGFVPLMRGSTADLEEVYALNIISFSEAWSRQSLANALDVGLDFRVYRAKEHQLAAYYLGQDVMDEVHILQLAVAPSFRGSGLASQIIYQILEEKCRLGMHTANLEVRASNRIAQRLYSRLGFSLIGRRKGYYDCVAATGNCEDALIMAREL